MAGGWELSQDGGDLNKSEMNQTFWGLQLEPGLSSQPLGKEKTLLDQKFASFCTEGLFSVCIFAYLHAPGLVCVL